MQSRSTPSHTQISHPSTISPGFPSRNCWTLNVHLLIRDPAKGCRSTNIGIPPGTKRAHPAAMAGVRVSGDLVVTSVSGCMIDMPNSVFKDTKVRITIDIDDARNAVQSPWHSVTWNYGCQYNNRDIPDNCGEHLDHSFQSDRELLGRLVNVRFWLLCKPLHSDHYAQFETMHRN